MNKVIVWNCKTLFMFWIYFMEWAEDTNSGGWRHTAKNLKYVHVILKWHVSSSSPVDFPFPFPFFEWKIIGISAFNVEIETTHISVLCSFFAHIFLLPLLCFEKEYFLAYNFIQWKKFFSFTSWIHFFLCCGELESKREGLMRTKSPKDSVFV